MRAFEITLFLLLIPAAMGLVNAMGIFGIGDPFTPDMYRYQNMTGTNVEANARAGVLGLGAWEMPAQPTFFDYVMFTVTMAWQFIFWAIRIVTAVVWLYPMLVTAFQVPWQLAIPLQIGIWVIWVVAIIQIKHAVSLDGLR